MNELRDLIEVTGNIVEEAWNNGRREALRETGANDLQATVTALEAANKVLGEKLEKAQARIEELETKQETEPEPKPCPFCGKEPRIYGDKPQAYIACVNKDCPVAPETIFFHTREKAIEAWNHRAGELTCDWR